MRQAARLAGSAALLVVSASAEAAPPAEGAAADQPPQVQAGADPLQDLEDDLFTVGVFPNTSGFMDARLRARAVYLDSLSSGLQADYFTVRSSAADTPTRRSSELRRELVLAADLLKWIVPFGGGGDPGATSDGFRWSLEPGVSGTFIVQGIESSGFVINGFGATVFRDQQSEVLKGGASIRLDLTAAAGRHLRLDLAFEGLPLVWSSEQTSLRTSEFATRPVEYSLNNRTAGLRLAGDLALRALPVGDFALSGRWFRNVGERSSRSVALNGNVETTLERYVASAEDDLWLELTHSLTYVHSWLGVTPGLALGWQRKVVTTSESMAATDSYKVGLILEVLR